MRIVEIREQTVPISSPIRNAYIDFSKMTLSLVAVITDVIRDGKPVAGYGFNSNGRYGQGKLMRERFIPRILEADPATLVDDTGDNLNPHKIWVAMFTNETGWFPQWNVGTGAVGSRARLGISLHGLQRVIEPFKGACRGSKTQCNRRSARAATTRPKLGRLASRPAVRG